MTDLQWLLARLIRPGAREDAYRELAELFSKEWTGELRSRLDVPRYSYRCNGLSAAYAKAEIDEYLNSHAFNQINPGRLMELFNIFNSIQPIDIVGKSILDFGSGEFNPLGFSILLYVNGAKRCVAYEPGDVSEKLSALGRKELIFAILEDPAAFRFTAISNDEMRRRVCNLQVELCRNRSEVSGVFDYVFSRSVFEHVDDVRYEAEFLARLCRGMQIHRVDFSDHRFSHPEYEKLLYMKDGILHNINGLLPSEMTRKIKEAGLVVEKYVPHRGRPVEDPIGRYADMAPEDKGVFMADYVLKRKREPTVARTLAVLRNKMGPRRFAR